MLESEGQVAAFCIPAYLANHRAILEERAWLHDGACCALACMTTIAQGMQEHHDTPTFGELSFAQQAFVVLELVRRGVDATSAEAVDKMIAAALNPKPEGESHA